MPRNNLEDATAKALDLLPHDDAARSDPRLVRDAKCLEEIRATQEAAADVWLATSPLRAAPPEVLSSIMSKVEARTPLAHRNVKFFPWLAASGWAAAAIAFILWPRDGEKASAVASVTPPVYMPSRNHAEVAGVAAGEADVAGLPALPDRRVVPNDRRLREELLRLQAEVNSFVEQGGLSAPRVLGLHSPNVLQPEPEETQRRMMAALTGALSSLLELERGGSGDPARMVLQRGWLPENYTPSVGEYIRHLNFPTTAAEDYNLMVSADGAYYDKARDMIWSPDENGRGFLGRRATIEDNLSSFYVPDESALASNRAVAVNTEPEGFVIEDPVSNTAKVLIDQVPPPAAGFEHVVIWTDANGKEARIPVDNPSASAATIESTSAAPVGVAPAPAATTVKEVMATADVVIPVIPSIAQAGTNRLFFSLPNSNGVKSFRLIELPSNANGVANGLLNGNGPVKVIVSGERRTRESKLK
ncbi:hypothetical protein [Luteolibacter soli]|uniref:Uncharacterized protein n=1 Tax=Luteolibacter soli TaxID=3135280 RepID=A0ABU9AN84_9BACT